MGITSFLKKIKLPENLKVGGLRCTCKGLVLVCGGTCEGYQQWLQRQLPQVTQSNSVRFVNRGEVIDVKPTVRLIGKHSIKKRQRRTTPFFEAVEELGGSLESDRKSTR